VQKDHLEIILEDIQGKFDLVLEGHAALDKKIDKKFDQLSEKIDINSFKIDALHQTVKQNSRKIDALDKKVEKNSRKIDVLDGKIDAVAADLKAHRQDTEAHPGILKIKKS
jgi:outer membrane murein-binding lipoprotein Lpp